MTRSRTATRDRFLTGARIGDYLVDREVSIEETGTIYLATHVVLPRQVALKVMHAASAWLRAVAMQMLREACLLEALSHPGIPRVYECGVLPDRRPWTAFERIDGITLSTLITSGTLPLVDLVQVLRDVADLLAHAHSRGVVHRALTPDAIVRTPDRSSRICVRHWDRALTIDTEIRESVDARDDIRALGLIAFRCMTGALPDPAFTTAERCPAAPIELASLIDQMLAADPELRPPAEEVRDRTRWLAETIEPLIDKSAEGRTRSSAEGDAKSIDKPRWTPPMGLGSEKLPVVEAGGFAVRIAPSRTS